MSQDDETRSAERRWRRGTMVRTERCVCAETRKGCKIRERETRVYMSVISGVVGGFLHAETESSGLPQKFTHLYAMSFGIFALAYVGDLDHSRNKTEKR